MKSFEKITDWNLFTVAVKGARGHNIYTKQNDHCTYTFLIQFLNAVFIVAK